MSDPKFGKREKFIESLFFPVFENVATIRLVCDKKHVVRQGQYACGFEFEVEMVFDFSMKLLFTFIT